MAVVEWVKVTDWSELGATAVRYKDRFVQEQDMITFANNAFEQSNANGVVTKQEFEKRNKKYFDELKALFSSIRYGPHEELLAKVQELLLVPVLV